MDLKITKNITDNIVKAIISGALFFICWIGQSALKTQSEINTNIGDIKTQMIILNFKYDKLEKRVEKVESKIDKVYYFNNKRDDNE